MFAVVALVSCDKGAPPKPAPPPAPAPAPPTGTIKGAVTHTLDGPGRAHAPEESFSRTSGRQCKVIARDASGKTIEATSNADTGAYEMAVPAGRYTVSFDACTDAFCPANEAALQTVEVIAGAAVEALWDCRVSAK